MHWNNGITAFAQNAECATLSVATPAGAYTREATHNALVTNNTARFLRAAEGTEPVFRTAAISLAMRLRGNWPTPTACLSPTRTANPAFAHGKVGGRCVQVLTSPEPGATKKPVPNTKEHLAPSLKGALSALLWPDSYIAATGQQLDAGLARALATACGSKL